MKYENEKLYQKEAFEKYYALGDERTVEEVAKTTNRSARTIYEWSRHFNWAERVVQRDMEVGRRLRERNMDAVVDEKANYRKVIKLAMSKIIREIQDDKFTSKGITDLERLIKLDMLLLGENTESVKVNATHKISEEDRQVVKELSNSIVSLVDEFNEAGEEE